MPNPKLETYKNKATGDVYDYTDADAQGKLSAILDGTDIDSFSDVESALADKVDVVSGKGLSTNDYDNTAKGIVDNIQSNVIANTKLIKDTVGWSGKNKLPKPNAASKTEYGTTYTYYPADQSFKVSTGGSASTGNCGMNFLARESGMKIPAGQYIVSKGTNNADIELYANAYSGSSFVFVRQLIDLTAENGTLTIDYADYDFVEVGLYVRARKNVPDTMVYPMFRPADILDPTYEPYRESVEEMLTAIKDAAVNASDFADFQTRMASI